MRAVGLRVAAALAALGSLGAGVQVINHLDPGQNARAETRGPNSPGNLPAQQQSPIQRAFMGGAGGFGEPYSHTHQKKPVGSVARDKRAARKRRNVRARSAKR